jgi:hypothetical protein
MARQSVGAALRGIGIGIASGIPQVVLTQAAARLLPVRDEQADIGPRFVQRVASQLEVETSTPQHWAIAALFHFGYAAWWGGLYALLQRWRPAQPHVGGPLLGALVYTLAFSPWGVATQTRTETSTDHRPGRETLLHWTAALSFSLTTAYAYDWLEGRRRRVSRNPPHLDMS